MPDIEYTDDELERYFSDPTARHGADAGGDGAGEPAPPAPAGRAADAGTGAAAASAGGDGAPSARRPVVRPSRKRQRDADRAPAAPLSERDEIKRRSFLVLRVMAGAVGVVALAGVVFLVFLAAQLPSLEQIENPKNLLSTQVYSADGVEIARFYRDENRSWVPLEDINPAVVDALIAVEDRRFRDHWGVNVERTLLAPVNWMRGQDGGASTITQQLARNVHAEVGREVSIIRKLKEILTAIQIERTYTKDEILEAYLNTVSFSHNAFGIETAAQTYFGKTAAELDAAEAATLVGMLKGPTAYDPVRNTERSRGRRNLILGMMRDLGTLPEAEWARLRETPIALDFSPYSHENNLAPHFAEYLRQWLCDWGDQNGYDCYNDGLRVYTSIDSRIQTIANEVVREQGDALQAVVDYEWSRAGGWSLGRSFAPYVARAERGDVDGFRYFWDRQTTIVNDMIDETEAYRRLRARGVEQAEAIATLRQNETFMDSLRINKTRIEVGFVALDPQTGFVKAWVGGRDFLADKYDHVGLAQRQPGSTFKPFVYTAAIDNGYHPEFRVFDSPFTYPGTNWRPTNSGGSCGCMRSLATSLQRSSNTATTRVVQMVGPEQVALYAHRLGVESELEPVPALGLGTSDVTLLEMAGAYATLANGGVRNMGPSMERDGRSGRYPPVVTRIEDQYGNLIADMRPASRRVLSESSAYTVVNMMRGVINGGTGSYIRTRYGLGNYDFAGKTGTTQNSADGWFIMMHPDLVMGAWVGWNDRRVAFRSSFWGQGGHNALHVVGLFAKRMAEAEGPFQLENTRFERPENYQPPSRRGSFGGGGQTWRERRPRRTRERSPESTGRPPQRARERSAPRPAERTDDAQGRIGW